MTSILKADTIQDTDGNNIINESSDTITIGASGDTITIPSGATITNSGTATGFGGITEADQWRLTAQASGDQTPLSANLERVDSDGFGKIGTGMTESSGIFTFPSTGVYKIYFDTHFSYNGSTRNIYTQISTTTDNSSYSAAAYSNSSIVQAESNYTAQHGHASFIFNVTDTSTHKVRFEVSSTVTILTQADTNANTTYMTFIRLGDSV